MSTNQSEEITYQVVNAPKTEEITLVYVGMHFNHKRKAWHSYWQLTPADHWEDPMGNFTRSGRHWSFDSKIHPGYGTPGTVFTVTQQGENSVLTDTAKVIGLWQNGKQRMVWQEEDNFIRQDLETQKQLKNLMEEDELAKILLPIKKLYLKSNNFQKNVLVMRIMKILGSDL
jgi:hypothetical protein